MQLPDSMKHSQSDLYLETYQVLDLEMSRLREIQRWQASAASKVIALEMALWISLRYLSLL
jgi:cytoplasmic FMR1 interacting protein